MNDIQDKLSHVNTSAARCEVIQKWLLQTPDVVLVTDIHKEWANKDKGVAKLLKQYLTQAKRTQLQGQAIEKWSQLAHRLLEQQRMSIADALAWQRDAAKEGAPLSQAVLAELKDKLMRRVTLIEDLQNAANVQKESSILLAQRLELLSTKSLAEVEAAEKILKEDVELWMQKTLALTQDSNWSSVDIRFATAVEQALAQLNVVWVAFSQVWEQTQEALKDERAPLPPVPHWAGQIQLQRRNLLEQEEHSQNEEEKARRAILRQQLEEQRKNAESELKPVLKRLEQELAQGHGKASAEAAQKLRDIFKSTEGVLGSETQAKVRTALAAAGELTGWQRWRADQLREELIVKAQALLDKPLKPKQQQESLRQLREEWKRTDLGGVPNHTLWRKFDETCTQAYQPVQVWVSALKEQEAEQVKLRESLIEEVAALAQSKSNETDFKALYRLEGQYQRRWREGGHLSEKQYEALHTKFKAAMKEAFSPLHQAQNDSINRRKDLIAQSVALSQNENFSTLEIKALQEKWTQETHAITLDRKTEQRLWEQFKKPIDAAFSRKDALRQMERKVVSQFESSVFTAAQALEQAAAKADALAIKQSLEALELTMKAPPAQADEPIAPERRVESETSTTEPTSTEPSSTEEKAESKSPAPPKTVVAVRGDDRPGAKSSNFGGGPPPSQKPARADLVRKGKMNSSKSNPTEESKSSTTPKLSIAALNAVRRARESAQKALRQLSIQAHGQAVEALICAWRERDPIKMPSVTDLGKAVKASTHKLWIESLNAKPASALDETALLRLEVATEQPSPPEFQVARRNLQLQLLIQKSGASPKESWPQDVASVLASSYSEVAGQRLLHVVKRLLTV